MLRTQQIPHKQVIFGEQVPNWLEEIREHLVEYHNFLSFTVQLFHEHLVPGCFIY